MSEPRDVGEARGPARARCGPRLLSDFTARPYVLEWCEPVRFSRVLELGCGDGYVTRQLRQRGAIVRGVDASETAILRARARERDERLGIEFAVGDVCDLSDVPSDSQDLVVAVFLFDGMDRSTTTIAMCEVRRVLRPGGRFVFAVSHPMLPFVLGNRGPYRIDARTHGYFSSRDAVIRGAMDHRDGESVPVRVVHKTLEDLHACLAHADWRAPIDLRELHVTREHVALDPEFFGPLEDVPLHLLVRIARPEGDDEPGR